MSRQEITAKYILVEFKRIGAEGGRVTIPVLPLNDDAMLGHSIRFALYSSVPVRRRVYHCALTRIPNQIEVSAYTITGRE